MNLEAKKNQNMVAGERGTLLQHGTEVRDGKTFRSWRTGPIKNRPEYSVGARGNLLHTFPQFKGSKKHRKKFKALLIAANSVTPPVGYYELNPSEKLVALDLIMNVATGKWMVTPYVNVTVQWMRDYLMMHPRACRKMTIYERKAACNCKSLQCSVCQA